MQSVKATADGISIRFPRIVRVRDDKTWKDATTISQLHHIMKASTANLTLSAPVPQKFTFLFVQLSLVDYLHPNQTL